LHNKLAFRNKLNIQKHKKCDITHPANPACGVCMKFCWLPVVTDCCGRTAERVSIPATWPGKYSDAAPNEQYHYITRLEFLKSREPVLK
jgi:hypothetical protein